MNLTKLLARVDQILSQVEQNGDPILLYLSRLKVDNIIIEAQSFFLEKPREPQDQKSN